MPPGPLIRTQGRNRWSTDTPEFWYRILIGLLAIDFGLLALNIWTPALIERTVHLDRESNFVVWYSSAKLLFCCVLAIAVGLRIESRQVLGWLALAGLFLAISIDETAMLHESVGRQLAKSSPSEPEQGHWLLPAIPGILAGIGLITWLTLAGLRTNRRARILAFAGFVCWLGAIGMECLQQYWTQVPWMHFLGYDSVWMTEETCEMAGASLFLGAIGLQLVRVK